MHHGNQAMALQGNLFVERQELPLPHLLAANFIQGGIADCRRAAEGFIEADWTAEDVCALLTEVRGITRKNIRAVRKKVMNAFVNFRKKGEAIMDTDDYAVVSGMR